jgi:8-oxo-dGTP pyrophosphatase MutT (NUDIX family)
MTEVADEPVIDGAIPAATLVVFGAATRVGGPSELLMVKRSPKMVFAAGAAVFPGGRVDQDDHAVAALAAPSLHPADAGARVAAIRETIEETGLAVGLPGVSADAVATIRSALREGALFSALLAEMALDIDLDALVPFARWCPNFKESRTFDTRFYAAQAPDLGHSLSVDDTENTHMYWRAAADSLADADRGEVQIIFPTRRNLERLALHGGFDAFVAANRHIPVRRITPWIETRDGKTHLCIPDDAGYPVTSESFERAKRG